MLIIDGSAGEGGGQVLRTALGLSLVTGTPFRTVEPTAHTRTQLALIPRFLDVRLDCQPEAQGTFRLTVRRAGA